MPAMRVVSKESAALMPPATPPSPRSPAPSPATPHAPALRLTIELVPATCWYANLRDVLSQAAWDHVRQAVYAASDNRCAVCGARPRQLHCHEVWDYDDATHVQRLAGFLALCRMCHHVKHIGHAGILASQGKLDLERVIAHFCRVNHCDRATYQEHYRSALATWKERSRYDWVTDLGDFAPAPAEIPLDTGDAADALDHSPPTTSRSAQGGQP